MTPYHTACGCCDNNIVHAKIGSGLGTRLVHASIKKKEYYFYLINVIVCCQGALT